MLSTRFALTAAFALAAAACADGDEGRRAELAAVYARADAALLRARPALVAAKYEAMAADPFAYFRGSIAVYLHDWREPGELAPSRYALAAPLVAGLGDPHPENFGVLVGQGEQFALRPNDFDVAERVPYLWDLRRLLVGTAVAVRASNGGDEAARTAAIGAEGSIVAAGARGYLDALAALAAGAGPATLDELDSRAAGEVVADAFERSREDWASREELDDLTALEGGARRLRRGVLDPADPTEAHGDLRPSHLAALDDTFARYRGTLEAPPPPEYFRVLDAARRFGSGVASLPRVRVFALVRGPSDDPADDVVLEVKEVADAGLGAFYPPEVHARSVPERVLSAARLAWGSADASPLFGTSTFLGLPVTVRLEAEGQKTLRVARLERKLGTPEALTELAATLGGLLARVHGAPVPEDPTPARAIVARVGADAEGFVAEQTLVARRYADRVEQDHDIFRALLADEGHGLGLPLAPGDAPDADAAALFGAPPRPETVSP